jgi:biotin operon repressor
MLNISELAQNAPQINLTITAADLRNFASELISQTKVELEQSISDSKAETYLSGEKVMEMMEISKTTLWRWKQRGYLVPVRVGGNDRYRLSDIQKIVEG